MWAPDRATKHPPDGLVELIVRVPGEPRNSGPTMYDHTCRGDGDQTVDRVVKSSVQLENDSRQPAREGI